MAKSLSSEEINSLIQATKNADRLTRLQVFALATSGLIDVVDGAFIVTGKGQRALKRQSRQAQQAAVVPVVMEAALEILDTNEAMCNHRAIWDRVGRDKFERDDVLDLHRFLVFQHGTPKHEVLRREPRYEVVLGERVLSVRAFFFTICIALLFKSSRSLFCCSRAIHSSLHRKHANRLICDR